MEPVTFLVVGLSVGAASALTWNLYHARNALQNVSDRTIVLSESQGAHAKQTTDALVLLQKKIDHYDDLLGALASNASNRRFRHACSPSDCFTGKWNRFSKHGTRCN